LWCRCESEVSVKNSFIGGVDEGPGNVAATKTPHTQNKKKPNFDAGFFDAICPAACFSFGTGIYAPREGDL
jgi:hypothetical protein